MAKNIVVAAPARKPGRPAIPMMSAVFDSASPKGASVRMDITGAKEAGNSPVLNAYFNREALKLAGVPAGYMPTKVEATFRVLETAVDPTYKAPTE